MDGVANLALKVAIAGPPGMFRSAMQKCLEEVVFPVVWKRQILVPLPKTGKPPGDPLEYRPILLIDTVGKLLEKIILNGMLKYIECIRMGNSTLDPILSVTETAEIALQRKRKGLRYCAVVSLDVRNAFNSASWPAIADALLLQRIARDSGKLLPKSRTC